MDLTAYFGLDSACDVKWAHAVNSRALLDAALADDGVHMLEADLMMSPRLFQQQQVEDAVPSPAGDGDAEDAIPSDVASANEVYMSHPPTRDSDLPFPAFLDAVLATVRRGRKVGFKLDFKEFECVLPCLRLLRERGMDGAATPLWLNADVVRGGAVQARPRLESTRFQTFDCEKG